MLKLTPAQSREIAKRLHVMRPAAEQRATLVAQVERLGTIATRSAEWNEADHPRRPDGKFGSATGGALGDVDQLNRSIASGIEDAVPLTGGSIAESVHLVTFGDGTLGVVKQDKHRERTDRELLTAKVGGALGAPVPAVVADQDQLDQGINGVYMQHVPGKTMAEADVGFNDPEFLKFEQSREGRLLGLMDAIAGNDDRNPGNLMIRPDGKMAGIDHGNADFEEHYGKHPLNGDPLPNGLAADEPFLRQFVDESGVLWKPGGFSSGEFDQMRPKLQSLLPEFEQAGRAEWHEKMMARFEAIAKTGTR